MRRPPRRLAALCVSALLLVACTSGDDPADAPAPGSADPGTILELRAHQPAAWQPSGRGWAVTLTWTMSPGAAADRYEVRRDGVPVARDLPQPTYRDPDVDPGADYVYTVLGTDPDGMGTPPAGISVRTGAPSIADARLQGAFLVDLRVTASAGLTDEAPSGRLLFRYGPRCDVGACPVRWSVRARSPEGVLTRSDAQYRGRARGPFMIRSCSGGPILERIEVTTRVVEAGPVAESWRATRVEGTLLETGHAPGCTPARIRWRFSGGIQT
jgi:hypothetical protein